MQTATFLSLTVILGLVASEYIPPGPKYRCPKEHLLLHPCKCETESDVGITVRCENTNLASMSVGLNNLATFELPIEQLTISECHVCKYKISILSFICWSRNEAVNDAILFQLDFMGVSYINLSWGRFI